MEQAARTTICATATPGRVMGAATPGSGAAPWPPPVDSQGARSHATPSATASSWSTARDEKRGGVHRARWAAIGAAIAVSIGAGGIGLVGAAPSPGGASMFVGSDPCRIVDTRNGKFHVGPFGTLAPNSKITIAASGNVGQCAGAKALPTNATGLQLNVTPVGATSPTHFTIYPGEGAPPNASSVNPVPGQPPIPNAVTVELDAMQKFSIYNLAGNVDVIVDVVGYFTDEFEISGDEIADLEWKPLTLMNGWDGTTAWTNTPPQYAIGAQGLVHLRGSMDNGSVGVAFQLPAEARPSDTKYLTTYTFGGSPGYLVILPNGNVSATNSVDGAANAHSFTSLDNISFSP